MAAAGPRRDAAPPEAPEAPRRRDGPGARGRRRLGRSAGANRRATKRRRKGSSFRPGSRRASPARGPASSWRSSRPCRAGRRRRPVTCIDYGPDRFETHTVENLDAFVESRRPDWVKVRWINVDGLDPAVIRALAIKYGLHPLAIEDLFNIDQRPKVETFDEGRRSGEARIFVVVRMIELVAGQLEAEQISIFVGHNTVLTFQEAPGDIWDPIRKRIAKPGSRFRAARRELSPLRPHRRDRRPLLSRYSSTTATGSRSSRTRSSTARTGRDDPGDPPAEARPAAAAPRGLADARGDQRPQREPHECVSEITRTYLRDVYDHSIQIMDIIETYREVAASLVENYMTSMSNRMTEVMKVLTIIGTIFIPADVPRGGLRHEHADPGELADVGLPGLLGRLHRRGRRNARRGSASAGGSERTGRSPPKAQSIDTTGFGSRHFRLWPDLPT